MKVLYVNHTSAISGGERSLLDLLGGLRDSTDARVACPSAGPLGEVVIAAGFPVDSIARTEGSLKLHPVHTPRALAALSAAAGQTALHARREGVDLLHANSIRAGLVAVPAARLLGIPAIVHVRDRLPRSAVADASLRLIAVGARIVIANSRYTAEGIREATLRGEIVVVHNPVDLSRFSRGRIDPRAVRAGLGLGSDDFVLAVIGQITPWKGQRDAAEAVLRLAHRGSRARLLIVGEPKFVSSATRYDNASYYAGLQRLITGERAHERVRLLGERSDVPAIISALDALLVPSWEEPFGRVVVEAMALGVPVIATRVGGPAEIIRDRTDGILLEPRNPELWANAIAELEYSSELRTRLGNAAARRATDFSVDRHVTAIRGVYQRVAGAGS